jgi:hypothetical protein
MQIYNSQDELTFDEEASGTLMQKTGDGILNYQLIGRSEDDNEGGMDMGTNSSPASNHPLNN